MKKSFRHVLTALSITMVGMLGLSACGTPASGPGAVDEKDGPGSSLVVYTTQGADARGEYVLEQAKAQLGLDITLVSGGGGELTDRAIAEKNNPQADVMLGIGVSQLSQLDAVGLVEKYTPEWDAQIPESFKNSKQNFSLYSQTPVVMAYNTEVMTAEQAPKSWEDLAKPEYKNKFVLPAPIGQTGQAVIAGILWRHADTATGEVSKAGWDLLKSIQANAKPVADGAKFDWKDVADGTLPIVVNWLGGTQTGAKDNNLTMQVIDATGGNPFVYSGVALVKDSKNADDAKKFIDWYGSADFQAEFVKATNNDTPINVDALKQLPEQAAALEPITMQDIDWSLVSQELKSWLQRIQLGL